MIDDRDCTGREDCPHCENETRGALCVIGLLAISIWVAVLVATFIAVVG